MLSARPRRLLRKRRCHHGLGFSTPPALESESFWFGVEVSAGLVRTSEKQRACPVVFRDAWEQGLGSCSCSLTVCREMVMPSNSGASSTAVAASPFWRSLIGCLPLEVVDLGI